MYFSNIEVDRRGRRGVGPAPRRAIVYVGHVPETGVNHMSNCMGEHTLSAKVDREMREYIEEQADERAITPSEFLRRVLDMYRKSQQGELTCAHCSQGIYLGQGV